jgi:hypothetical protein
MVFLKPFLYDKYNEVREDKTINYIGRILKNGKFIFEEHLQSIPERL